jgi:translation initiation factor 1
MNMRKNMGPANGGLVYSTELGRTCPVCRRAQAQCICASASAAPAGDGVVRVSRQTSGRRGKVVTLVKGLALDADALLALGKRLRSACGAGGTTKDGVIEVQGDHVELLCRLLAAEGRVVKRSGG